MTQTACKQLLDVLKPVNLSGLLCQAAYNTLKKLYVFNLIIVTDRSLCLLSLTPELSEFKV